MIRKSLLFLLNFLYFQSLRSERILGIFPHHGFSHFKIYHPLLFGLAERGHHVTVIAHIKSNQQHQNYEELLLEGKQTVNIIGMDEFVPDRSLRIIIEEYFALLEEGQESCRALYESGFVEKVLKKHEQDPYDLIITEFFNSDCQFGLVALINAPVIGISSCALMPWYYDRIALPDFPSYVQSEFMGFQEKLSFDERMINFIQTKGNKLLYRYTNYLDQQLIQKYLQKDVNVRELAGHLTALVFVNQHFSLSGTRPFTNQYVEIGGIHLSKEVNTTLSPQIEKFLESSENGVLLISWGSVLRASSLDTLRLKEIVTVLKTLPLNIIWKWETDDLPVRSDKFLFLKWIPQTALLAHPKVKRFWSHGGLLGTTEAVYFGKPLVVTPFYGDQFLNGNAVSNRKVGKILYYKDMSLQNMQAVFKEIMQPEFDENAKILSRLFRDRPMKALDSAIWWTEYILNHPNATRILQSSGTDLNWFIYYSLDCIALIVFSTIGILFMSYKILFS